MTSLPSNVTELYNRVMREFGRVNFSGYVAVQNYTIGVGTYFISLAKRVPPTRGQVIVLRIRANDKGVESWASRNHIDDALEVFRKHHVLDDLADV